VITFHFLSVFQCFCPDCTSFHKLKACVEVFKKEQVPSCEAFHVQSQCSGSFAVLCLDFEEGTLCGVCGSPLKTLEFFSLLSDQVQTIYGSGKPTPQSMSSNCVITMTRMSSFKDKFQVAQWLIT